MCQRTSACTLLSIRPPLLSGAALPWRRAPVSRTSTGNGGVLVRDGLIRPGSDQQNLIRLLLAQEESCDWLDRLRMMRVRVLKKTAMTVGGAWLMDRGRLCPSSREAGAKLPVGRHGHQTSTRLSWIRFEPAQSAQKCTIMITCLELDEPVEHWEHWEHWDLQQQLSSPIRHLQMLGTA